MIQARLIYPVLLLVGEAGISPKPTSLVNARLHHLTPSVVGLVKSDLSHCWGGWTLLPGAAGDASAPGAAGASAPAAGATVSAGPLMLGDYNSWLDGQSSDVVSDFVNISEKLNFNLNFK
ncbi:Ephrin type-A receptor 6 [Frankliniella fusca]|uniref:Ephrin type-A receptor 6 n=1 Tax=Frankliniella fusca TaxID=407009 RepID=A0AAE1LDU5_9NEOP|nr:Ephrin type-A receptor 6 [Frankliniella fusca]